MKIFETVADIMASYINCDVSEITEESTLESLQLDSLDMVEIVMSIEEAFGISIDEMEGITTVAEMVKVIEESLDK